MISRKKSDPDFTKPLTIDVFMFGIPQSGKTTAIIALNILIESDQRWTDNLQTKLKRSTQVSNYVEQSNRKGGWLTKLKGEKSPNKDTNKLLDSRTTQFWTIIPKNENTREFTQVNVAKMIGRHSSGISGSSSQGVFPGKTAPDEFQILKYSISFHSVEFTAKAGDIDANKTKSKKIFEINLTVPEIGGEAFLYAMKCLKQEDVEKILLDEDSSYKLPERIKIEVAKYLKEAKEQFQNEPNIEEIWRATKFLTNQIWSAHLPILVIDPNPKSFQIQEEAFSNLFFHLNNINSTQIESSDGETQKIEKMIPKTQFVVLLTKDEPDFFTVDPVTKRGPIFQYPVGAMRYPLVVDKAGARLDVPVPQVRGNAYRIISTQLPSLMNNIYAFSDGIEKTRFFTCTATSSPAEVKIDNSTDPPKVVYYPPRAVVPHGLIEIFNSIYSKLETYEPENQMFYYRFSNYSTSLLMVDTIRNKLSTLVGMDLVKNIEGIEELVNKSLTYITDIEKLANQIDTTTDLTRETNLIQTRELLLKLSKILQSIIEKISHTSKSYSDSFAGSDVRPFIEKIKSTNNEVLIIQEKLKSLQLEPPEAIIPP